MIIVVANFNVGTYGLYEIDLEATIRGYQDLDKNLPIHTQDAAAGSDRIGLKDVSGRRRR